MKNGTVKNTIANLIRLTPMVVEFVVVGASLFFIIYLVYGLIDSTDPSQSKSAKILVVLNANWKALLILALVPIYRPIHRFIVELKSLKAGPVTAERGEKYQQQPVVLPQEEPSSQEKEES